MLVAVVKKQKRLSNQLNFKIKVQFYYLRIYIQALKMSPVVPDLLLRMARMNMD